MKKPIIPILIISLFILLTSCNNSLSDALKENEARLVGFMDTYRAVKGYYNSYVLEKAEGEWDLSTYKDEKKVLEIVENTIYAKGDDFDKITSAKGTFSNKTENTEDGTKHTLTFSGVEIKYTPKDSEEEKTLTIDGVLSTCESDETTTTESTTTYDTNSLIYFKQNGVEYKSISSVVCTINYRTAGVSYTFESAFYDGHKINCNILNKSNFLKND